MKILFVAAEVAPFSSIGGLSQVMYYLPLALAKLGHDVRVFTAKYGVIDGSGGNQQPKKKWKLEMVSQGLAVPVGDNGTNTPNEHNGTFLVSNVKMSRAGASDPIVYFLENREYYELRANVYEYADDHMRFALLSKGCLEWLLQARGAEHVADGKTEEGNFATSGHSWWPDLIHINDWHTGYLADMARKDPRYRETFKDTPIVYTIHNFRHQGNGSYDFRFGPKEDRDMGESPLPSLFDPTLLKINALVRGVVNADVVNTVSKTHAEEILTPEYGEGIEDILLKYRKKLTGILNGVDTRAFNPTRDRYIARRFSLKTLSDRTANKIALQKEFSLPLSTLTPLLAISGRMDKQKGIDLVMEALPQLLSHEEFQLVVLGGGDEQYRNFFLGLARQYPGRVGVHLQPDFKLPRKIFAGADMLLLPSKFEPGGIVAMEAMRYGCVPVVRRTGGLNDIIIDFDPDTSIGDGFSFASFDMLGLYGAVIRALTNYRDARQWKKIITNCLRQDFSWDHAAREYEDLYERVARKQ